MKNKKEIEELIEDLLGVMAVVMHSINESLIELENVHDCVYELNDCMTNLTDLLSKEVEDVAD